MERQLTGFQVSYEMNGVQYQSKFTTKVSGCRREKILLKTRWRAGQRWFMAKSKYTGWQLKEISCIENKNNTIQYRLFVRKSGWKRNTCILIGR